MTKKAMVERKYVRGPTHGHTAALCRYTTCLIAYLTESAILRIVPAWT